MLSEETTNTNFIVFGFSSKKPTIYHTRGEHANHYTSDAVANIYYATKVLKKKEEKKCKKCTLKVSDYCFIFQPYHGECNVFS